MHAVVAVTINITTRTDWHYTVLLVKKTLSNASHAPNTLHSLHLLTGLSLTFLLSCIFLRI